MNNHFQIITGKCVLVLEPRMVNNLNLMFKRIGEDIAVKKKQFQQRLNQQMIVESDQVITEADTSKEPIVQEKDESGQKRIKVSSLTVICLYQFSSVYMIILNGIEVLTGNRPMESNVQFYSQGFELHDIRKSPQIHRTVIRGNKSFQSMLDFELCFYEPGLSEIQKYNTYMAIRITSAHIVFLKRQIMEMKTYFKELLGASFTGNAALDLDFKAMAEQQAREYAGYVPKEGEGFRFDLIILDSQIDLKRHSLSHESIFIQMKEIQVQKVSKWGQGKTFLLQTGLLKGEEEMSEHSKN